MFALLALFACADKGPTVEDDTAAADDTGGAVTSDPLPDLVVNEILAANATINTDAATEYDDWVEIHNTGSSIVQFTSLYLTDDQEDPTKYELPADQGISPGGYLLIWCDAQIDQGDDHAPFKLNKKGDFIGIYYAAAGATPRMVDGIDFSDQTADIASARVPDGTTNWVQQAPTPLASNGG